MNLLGRLFEACQKFLITMKEYVNNQDLLRSWKVVLFIWISFINVSKVFWKVQFLLLLFIIFLFPLLVCIFSHTPYFLVQYFRLYFPTSLSASLDALSRMLTNAFNEFAEMNRNIKIGKDPIFNLVPVLGAGKSSASMDDIITCELLARK